MSVFNHNSKTQQFLCHSDEGGNLTKWFEEVNL